MAHRRPPTPSAASRTLGDELRTCAASTLALGAITLSETLRSLADRADRVEVAHSTLLRAAQEHLTAMALVDRDVVPTMLREQRAQHALRTLIGEG